MLDDFDPEPYPDLNRLSVDELKTLAEAEGVTSEALEITIAYQIERQQLLTEQPASEERAAEIDARLEEIADDEEQQRDALIDDIEIMREELERPHEEDMSDTEGDEDGP